MKNLLVAHKCTRTTGRRKGPGVRSLALVALSLAGATVGTELAAARELLPDPRDSEEAVRWSSVVPRPLESRAADQTWSVGSSIVVDWGSVRGAELENLSDRLDRLWKPLGRTWHTLRPPEVAQVTFEPGPEEGESYSLVVDPTGVRVLASGAAGRYYALITLGQLLPASSRPQDPVAALTGTLTDRPAYSWRGLMLDSSRHVQSVATLEWILELMAQHKLNRFHWHLTDDQGWRLPVAGWPRLTEVGAWRVEADGTRYGGSYTAAEIRRVVAYAEQRQIVIIPEIDLPGHSSAALAAYPELSASGLPRKVPIDWGVADGVLSLGRASVLRFTNDVLKALTELFPGPWIHWGGDEVYRSPWTRNAESLAWMKTVRAATPDQAVAAFWNDLARRTLAAGRTPIGWDEVALHQPPPGTIVQWWDDPTRALAALENGFPVVSSWKETTYLDYPEWDGDGDRALWMPAQPLANVAAQPFWPPGTRPENRSQILGIEAGLWTERAAEPKLGRKLFPRLALVADLAWSGPERGGAGWSQRIDRHRQRLEAWGVGMPPPLR